MWFLVLLAIAFYFLPTISAVSRGKLNTASVAVINFFFGWTFIGWVIALAMAVGQDPQQQVIVVQSKS